MGRHILQWWESRSGRARVFLGMPIGIVVLFIFHQAFPLLSWKEALMYSVMECVPLSLVLAWATQNELRRRAELEQRMQSQGDDVTRS